MRWPIPAAHSLRTTIRTVGTTVGTTSVDEPAPFAIAAVAPPRAAAIVAGLIAWIVLDRRHLLGLIEDIEARGITRRSQRSGGEKP